MPLSTRSPPALLSKHAKQLAQHPGRSRPISTRCYPGEEAQAPLELAASTAGDGGVRGAVKSAEGAAVTPLPVRLFPTLLAATQQTPQQEKLAATNAARHDWIAAEGRQHREAHGRYQRTADVRISATDADATPIRLKGSGTYLG